MSGLRGDGHLGSSVIQPCIWVAYNAFSVVFSAYLLEEQVTINFFMHQPYLIVAVVLPVSPAQASMHDL